ncbi:MAG: hypothetical protein WDM76_04845 [Limisphaerales bacterium]
MKDYLYEEQQFDLQYFDDASCPNQSCSDSGSADTFDPRLSGWELKPALSLEPWMSFNIPLTADPDELLRHRFFVSWRRSSTRRSKQGLGKSSLAMQMMIKWALGESLFGIEPAKTHQVFAGSSRER